jgi:predicted RNase H-like nuclease (RuvC/YqgF family)
MGGQNKMDEQTQTLKDHTDALNRHTRELHRFNESLPTLLAQMKGNESIKELKEQKAERRANVLRSLAKLEKKKNA